MAPISCVKSWPKGASLWAFRHPSLLSRLEKEGWNGGTDPQPSQASGSRKAANLLLTSTICFILSPTTFLGTALDG